MLNRQPVSSSCFSHASTLSLTNRTPISSTGSATSYQQAFTRKYSKRERSWLNDEIAALDDERARQSSFGWADFQHYLARFGSCTSNVTFSHKRGGFSVVASIFKDEDSSSEMPLALGERTLLSLAVLGQLVKYVYPSGYLFGGKFSVVIKSLNETGQEYEQTVGHALSLFDRAGNFKPSLDHFREIRAHFSRLGEQYDKDPVLGMELRVYSLTRHVSGEEALRKEQLDPLLPSLYQDWKDSLWNITPAAGGGLKAAERIKNTTSRPKFITSLKTRDKERGGFFVSDIETVPVLDETGKEAHVAYAIAYAKVTPGDNPAETGITTFFSESPAYKSIHRDLRDRSHHMLADCIRSLIPKGKPRTAIKVFLHNMGRFDGIILLRVLVDEFKTISREVIEEATSESDAEKEEEDIVVKGKAEPNDFDIRTLYNIEITSCTKSCYIERTAQS